MARFFFWVSAVSLAIMVAMLSATSANAAVSNTKFQSISIKLERYASNDRLPVPSFAERDSARPIDGLSVNVAVLGSIPVPQFADRSSSAIEPGLINNFAKTGSVPLPQFAERSTTKSTSNSLVVAGYQAKPIPEFAERAHGETKIARIEPNSATGRSKLTNRGYFWVAGLAVDKTGKSKDCLAKAIYFEARSEARSGQLAVAQVILNRVRSGVYPDTICGVIYQNAEKRHKCQFSFACDGQRDEPANANAWENSTNLAGRILCVSKCASKFDGHSPLGNLSASIQRATHYHADYAAPSWRKRLKHVGNIGVHIFYESKRVWLSV